MLIFFNVKIYTKEKNVGNTVKMQHTIFCTHLAKIDFNKKIFVF